jgi:tetratricopeptide (TPR) repeat protein
MDSSRYLLTFLLQENNFADAVALFQAVLDCQKSRHGPLHADVGAALHNVGIAQLRAHNYPEALKAFEEAARVRKGSLGRDHPQVAVSLGSEIRRIRYVFRSSQ